MLCTREAGCAMVLPNVCWLFIAHEYCFHDAIDNIYHLYMLIPRKSRDDNMTHHVISEMKGENV